MPTLDGSSPPSVFGDAAALTSLTTASFTPPTGSIIVVKTAASDAITTVPTPTATGVTFTSRANVGTNNASTRNAVFTGVGAGSAITVTQTFTGTNGYRALTVEVWTSSQLATTPAVHTIVAGSGSPSDAVTTVAAGSVVTWTSGDWAAIDGTTRTYRSSASEVSYHRAVGQYTIYNAYQAAATAGSQTYGLSAPVGQTFTMVGLEIQSSGGAAAATRIRTIGKRR
jgi:hypothetical protein